MENRKISTTTIGIFLVCLLYAYTLQALPVMGFMDRQNYFNQAAHSDLLLLANLGSGVSRFFANEPLWFLINWGLSRFLDPETVMRSIIFSGSFIASLCLLRSNPKNILWLIGFLISSTFLKNYITHLRQGFAMAIFYAGFFSQQKFRKWVLMSLAVFIHTSFFFLITIVIIPPLLKRLKLAVDVRIILLIFFSLFISTTLGVLAPLLGARQGTEQPDQMADVSGLGFIFWAVVLAIFVSQGRKFIIDHQIAFGVLILYLVSYFFIVFTARIFESGLPIVFIAGLALHKERKITFLGAYFIFSVIQWTMRLYSANPF